jgi:hypothetical protein
MALNDKCRKRSTLMRMFSKCVRGAFPTGCFILLILLTPGCFDMLQRPVMLSRVDHPLGFERDIKAIMERFCLDCHGVKNREAGLDLRTLRSSLSGGESGPAIVPGDPQQSMLFHMVKDGHMPPEGKRPGAYQLRRLRQWIASGAHP